MLDKLLHLFSKEAREAGLRKRLEKLRADGPPFDLLLTDHNMPGMSGLDLVREIRFEGRVATSIVICSAMSA